MGNAFYIIGRVRAAMKDGGVPVWERDLFSQEAMDGNYDQLLQTVMRWVAVA